MHHFLRILPLLLLTIFNCTAQQNEFSHFIPKGYVAVEKQFGDLNNDDEVDCVIIIKKTDKNNIVKNRFDKKVDQNRRGLIILLKNGNSYRIADKNYDCFSSENEDGGVYYQPQLSIKIKKGNLIVNYNHGRYGFWNYTFRFKNSHFELINYDATHGGAIIESELYIDFLTKKKLVIEYTNTNEENNETFKETWYDIEIEPLLKLSSIKDFDTLEMYHF
ncbi:hypothetical protein [Lacinutrix sp.]|uniref:hypothetical protein n=1 Tax=Lacinutrix sp. TaxID=1937692 RepID=UPI0026097538|nr:hypothetical protein [Lacinutrix sp.]MDG1714521.1 hypothetical protein [Lacinutrix sp.]